MSAMDSGGSKAVRCGLCENYQATLECEQCQGPLCENCSTYIHSKGMYRMHRVLPIGTSATRAARMCPEHGKDLDLFCTMDSEIVCSHCLLVGEHRQHSCVALKDASLKAREALETAMTELASTRDSVNGAREVAVDTIPRVHQEYDSALLGILEAFARVRAAIDERETQVRNQLYHVREVKVHLLAQQIDALEETLGATDEAVRAAERLLSRGDDFEIVQMRPAVATRLLTLARAGHELEPKADSTFLYTFQDETEESAKSFGYIDVSVLDEDIDPAVLRRIQTDLKQRETGDDSGVHDESTDAGAQAQQDQEQQQLEQQSPQPAQPQTSAQQIPQQTTQVVVQNTNTQQGGQQATQQTQGQRVVVDQRFSRPSPSPGYFFAHQ